MTLPSGVTTSMVVSSEATSLTSYSSHTFSPVSTAGAVLVAVE